MRRSLTLSVFTLLMPVILCAGSVTINGKITNRLSDEITFSAYDGFLEYNLVERKANLDKEGRFSVVFPVSTGYTEISIQHGNQASELMLKDGDVVTMALDASDFDKTMHYTGTGAATANFVAKRVLDRGMTRDFLAKFQPLMAMKADGFVSESRGLLKSELGYLEQHKQGLPEAFIKYWVASLTYYLYYNWLIYPAFHQMVTKKELASDKLASELYTVPRSVPLVFDDGLMSVQSYRLVVGSILNNHAGRTDSIHAARYKADDSATILANQLLPEKTREFYFAQKLKTNVKYATVAKVDSDFIEFKSMFPESEFIPVLDKSIMIKRQLGAGQPAIDFAFTTLDGQKMKLSDLKGKVVYIDFWASWCGPCMNELPSVRKVKEHFKGRDLVFVNISIDEDVSAWKSAIVRKNIDGINICEPGGWKSPLALLYGVQSVPSYFLIDRDGKFITEVTPRPSDTDNLISLIEKALN